jgi:hypothetical protein
MGEGKGGGKTERLAAVVDTYLYYLPTFFSKPKKFE